MSKNLPSLMQNGTHIDAETGETMKTYRRPLNGKLDRECARQEVKRVDFWDDCKALARGTFHASNRAAEKRKRRADRRR